MKTKTVLAVTTIGAVLTLTARADFFDNFDSYTTGSLNGQGGWVVDTGTLNVTAANSSSAPNSVVWASSASSRAHRAVGAANAGEMTSTLDWSFKFNDVGATRDYNALYAYTGGWTVGLQSAMGFGDYNSVVGKYMGRYSAISGATYADGALSDGGTAGWFSLGNGGGNGTLMPKAQGWHQFEVKGQVDPINGAGRAELQFFIDNSLVGTVANLADYSFTWATIGGAVSVGITGGNTDDYSVMAVPEPSSIALCALGGLVLATLRTTRRRV